MPGTPIDAEGLRREVLRVHARYAREVVEAFDFCPWARAAREGGRVRTVVLFGANPHPQELADEVRALESDADIDIGLLALPEVILDRIGFQHLAAQVRALLDKRGPCGRVFAVADFHPDASADLSSPERLVAFLRRSPDPILQLVRRGALDAARLSPHSGTRFVDSAQLAGQLEHAPEPVHARVARHNHRTVGRELARVSCVLDDILQDRHASYAVLGVPPPPWAR